MAAARRGQTDGMANTPSTSTKDVIDAVLEDHIHFRTLFVEFDAATGKGREEVWQQIVRGLAVHETAEEEIVHPQVRRLVDGGDDIVDARLSQEDAAKKTLAELEELGADSPDFDRRVHPFMQEVLHHATDEESEELSALREVADAKSLARMARLFEAAKAVAPTHAHKAAPESATGNIVLGPFVAIADRVRDAIRDAMAKDGA